MSQVLPKTGLLLFLVLSGCASSASTDNEFNASKYPLNKWTIIEKGLEYEPLQTENTNLHLIRINPGQLQLKIVQNLSNKDPQTIREVEQKEHSPFAVNGSFFDEKFKPTGLLISNFQSENELNSTSTNSGVFTIDRNHRAELYSSGEFSKLTSADLSNFEFAIQNNPVLLDREGKNSVPKDSGKKAGRTAIGIDGNGNLILIILHPNLSNLDNQLSLYQFAQLLESDPNFRQMGLHSALNLDGGPSTGFALMDNYYPEITPVQNIIVTSPRS